MAKLTSQNSSKPKTAKSKTTNEEKKVKALNKKAAFAVRKISQLATKEKVRPETSQELHISVVSTNGHSGLAPKRPSPDPALDLQERVRCMVKLSKEQGYVTYDDINEALPENMADPEEMEQLINRLRSMEVDIIDASEVDRYKDGKKNIDDEEEEKDQKLDILDDPVRMYLNQMGQVALLTREQEVEISKRIEDAETEITRVIYSLGFAGKEHIALAEKLLSEPPRERFDRVILEKKVDSRDAHLRTLRKLIARVHKTDEEVDHKYTAWRHAHGKAAVRRALAAFKRADQQLQGTFQKFCCKQNVVQEMMLVAENIYDKLQYSLRALA